MEQKYEVDSRFDILVNILFTHRLSEFLVQIKSLAEGSRFPHLREVYEDIRGNYHNLLFYMKQGVSDPERSILYGKLIRQAYDLLVDLQTEHGMMVRYPMFEAFQNTKNVNGMDTVAEIKTSLENFVSSIALTELYQGVDKDEKVKTLYEEHRRYMGLLFQKLLISMHWSKQYATEMRDLLLSPTVDSRDRQQMVSAITLNLFEIFDIEKFSVLLQLYQRSEDEYVKQRALVGWTICLSDFYCDLFPEIRTMVNEVIDSEDVRKELLQLQEQIIYCAETDKETKKIQTEIIPHIMRHRGTLNFTEFGVEEKEDDLQNILDPGASERAMEDVEQSMGKMMDMMKQGADIYFGGFSKMKQYTFFNNISNWFCPFYLQHPGLQCLSDESRNSKFMEYLMHSGPFCNSDKYSFALTIDKVFKTLPPSVKEMLGNQDALGQVLTDDMLTQPMYIRRMYLQDLYRFWLLYPHAIQLRPFFRRDHGDGDDTQLFFVSLHVFDSQKIRPVRMKLAMFLFALHRPFNPLELFAGDRQCEDNLDYLKLCARCFANDKGNNKVQEAIGYCQKVLSLQPDDEKIQLLLGRLYFKTEQYEHAAHIYDQLAAAHPEKKGIEKNCIACLSNVGKHEEALKRLYKLYYEYPDDADVVRLLAYNTLHAAQFEKSTDYYKRLSSMTSLTTEDYISAGYSTWLQGKIQETYQWFAHVNKVNDKIKDSDLFYVTDTLRVYFQEDQKFLLDHGISLVDMQIMADLFYSGS